MSHVFLFHSFVCPPPNMGSLFPCFIFVGFLIAFFHRIETDSLKQTPTQPDILCCPLSSLATMFRRLRHDVETLFHAFFFPKTNARENISTLNHFPFFFFFFVVGLQEDNNKKNNRLFLKFFPPPFLTGEKKKKKILVSCYFPTHWYIRPCVCLIWPW